MTNQEISEKNLESIAYEFHAVGQDLNTNIYFPNYEEDDYFPSTVDSSVYIG